MRGKIITFNGESHNKKEWAEILGISYGALKVRFRKWKFKDIFTTPKFIQKQIVNGNEKYCAGCNNWLTFNSFHKCKNTKSKRATYCVNCTSKRMVNTRYKHRYGITQKDKEYMLKEQENKCAICNKEMKVSCIDHDHNTKVVRGLLCIKCNAMLGHIDINNIPLEEIVLYIKDGYTDRRKRFPITHNIGEEQS